MSNLVTYASWKLRLLGEEWPSGYPENLVNSLNSFFNLGCMDIQRHVKSVQLRNVALFPFCATYFNGWTTWVDVPAPTAQIRMVYTVANNDFTNRVFYRQREYGQVLEWSQNRLCRPYGLPPATTLPPLPLGDRYADPLTDKYQNWILPIGATNGRARRGIWATRRQRLFLAPWVQSNETIVAEWDGVKVAWADTDMIDLTYWTPQFEAALKWYVRWQYQACFGADRTAEQFARQHWEDRFAELINDDIKLERSRTEEEIPETYASTTAELMNEQVSQTPVVTTVGIIGNYGADNATEASVATQVAGWGLQAIITAGGNNMVDPTTLATWDATVGQFYSKFIFPYTGDYGVGASENLFWPAIGDAELLSSDEFNEYFGGLQGRRYYTTLVGDIQFFVLSSSPQEPDGNTIGSTQANWLQAALAFSTARWKVVVLNGSPYSSGPIGSIPALQWPFQQWGADLIVSGNEAHYERFQSGIPYIVCGSSGNAGLSKITTPIGGSVVQNSTSYGALVVKSTQPYAIAGQIGDAALLFKTPAPAYTEAVLEIAFLDSNGVQQDYLKLTKGAAGAVAPVLGPVLVPTSSGGVVSPVAGAAALPVGQSTFTLELNLPFTPGLVVPTVTLPAGGGLALNPRVIGIPTASAATIDLGGVPDGPGYEIGWVAYPAVGATPTDGPVSGWIPLPSGTSTWAFNPNLTFTPSVVLVTITLPSGGGLALNPRVLGTPTGTLVTVDLGGTTDGSGYGLGWVALP